MTKPLNQNKMKTTEKRNLDYLQLLESLEVMLMNGNSINPDSVIRGAIQLAIGKEVVFNMTPKERAEMLFENHFLIQDLIEWTDKETMQKAENLNDELGTDVEIYWRKLAKQSAIITVDYVIGNCRDEILQEYWINVKQEIINL